MISWPLPCMLKKRRHYFGLQGSLFNILNLGDASNYGLSSNPNRLYPTRAKLSLFLHQIKRHPDFCPHSDDMIRAWQPPSRYQNMQDRNFTPDPASCVFQPRWQRSFSQPLSIFVQFSQLLQTLIVSSCGRQNKTFSQNCCRWWECPGSANEGGDWGGPRPALPLSLTPSPPVSRFVSVSNISVTAFPQGSRSLSALPRVRTLPPTKTTTTSTPPSSTSPLLAKYAPLILNSLRGVQKECMYQIQGSYFGPKVLKIDQLWHAHDDKLLSTGRLPRASHAAHLRSRNWRSSPTCCPSHQAPVTSRPPRSGKRCLPGHFQPQPLLQLQAAHRRWPDEESVGGRQREAKVHMQWLWKTLCDQQQSFETPTDPQESGQQQCQEVPHLSQDVCQHARPVDAHTHSQPEP